VEASANKTRSRRSKSAEMADFSQWTRIQLVVFIVAVVLFALLLLFPLYRVCEATVLRLKQISKDGKSRKSERERRISAVLADPAVSRVLGERAREAIREEQVENERRIELENSRIAQNPLPRRPSRIRFAAEENDGELHFH